MAITVTPNLDLISNCDAITGWSGDSGNFVLDEAIYNQGSGSLSDWVNATTSALYTYGISSTDMSDTHLYMWVRTAGRWDTKANGGICLYASDGTNNSTWYVGGVDTVAGGWQLVWVDINATPDESSGTLNPAAVTTIGCRFKITTAALKQGQAFMNNLWFDIIRYGSGLTITSADTDDITLADIYAEDDNVSNKYGIVRKSYGAYVLGGTLTMGDTGTSSIDVVIASEMIIFPDNLDVSATLNTLELLGNSTGSSHLDVNGSFIKANNVPLIFDVDNANVDTVSIIGNTIINASALTFASGQTCEANVLTDIDTTTLANTPTGCTWNLSGLITVSSGGGIEDFASNESTAAIAITTADPTAIKRGIFTSDGTGHAMEATATGDYDWDGHQATGYAGSDGSTGNETFYNNSGGHINLAVKNGAGTPSIMNGTSATTTLITVSVDLTMVVTDQDTNEIDGAFAYIDDNNETPFIMNTTTNVSGIATVTHTAGAVPGSTWRVRKYGYKPFVQVVDISTSDITLPITLITDPQQT